MTEGKLRKLMADVGIEVLHKTPKGWLVSKCPFAPWTHEYGTDSSPSFTIKVNETGYSGFNCFTCKKHGHLTKLLTDLGDLREMDYTDKANRAMMSETPEQFDDFESSDFEQTIEPIDEDSKEIYLMMYPLAYEDNASKTYLKSRGITEEAAEMLDLRYDPDTKRVVFPVYDNDNNLYGFTGRTTLPDSYLKTVKRYPKVKDYAGLKKEKCILGEQLIRHDKQRPLLVVEGLFALAHMVSIGALTYFDVVATMGSTMSEDQMSILLSYDRPVYFCYDDDKAGNEGLFGEQDLKKSRDEGETIYMGGGAIDLIKDHAPTYACFFPDGITDPDLLKIEDVANFLVEGESEFFS